MTYPAGATRAFQYGLGIFALTALIGLTNAAKIIGDVDRNTLLTIFTRGRSGGSRWVSSASRLLSSAATDRRWGRTSS
ncbi:MAG: hypothetical protein AUH33_01745 [Chloroflexi bacterium 13_1_40CM_68_21]|nr:MAG: hypothetical protein AUH33_01745 [Chloroflexi bacterium 13_1_40CM_68_21]